MMEIQNLFLEECGIVFIKFMKVFFYTNLFYYGIEGSSWLIISNRIYGTLITV